MVVRKYRDTTDVDCEVEFREAIAGTIPLLIKRLEDKHEDVRLEIVDLIGDLANHGKWQLESTVA